MAKMLKLSTGTRSGKMRRYWTFAKALQRNYHPDKPIAWVRRELKKRNNGLKNRIDDVEYQNPSP